MYRETKQFVKVLKVFQNLLTQIVQKDKKEGGGNEGRKKIPIPNRSHIPYNNPI